ncbi:MAG: T9SS type A sorting domain-containing protein, partial [Bacteroidota bacterium]
YGMYDSKLIEIDREDGTRTVLASLPSARSAYTSLVCNGQGELFFIDNATEELYTYSIADESLEKIAFLGLNTPGDLTFFRGNLIFPSYPYIWAFHLEEQSLTPIFCLPDVNSVIWGLANDFDACDENRILAANFMGEIWEINFEDDAIVNLGGNEREATLYGMASSNEHFAYDCSFRFEEVDCSIMTNVSNPAADLDKGLTLYPNPTHDLLSINSTQAIDKLELYNSAGQLLTAVDSPEDNISLSGLEPGVYICKCHLGNQVVCKRIIKL